MTHYEIRYDSFADENAKRLSAMKDITEYLGADQFAKMNSLLTQAVASKEVETPLQFRRALFMLGIQGYPLKAWWDTICIDIDLDFEWHWEGEVVSLAKQGDAEQGEVKQGDAS